MPPILNRLNVYCEIIEKERPDIANYGWSNSFKLCLGPCQTWRTRKIQCRNDWRQCHAIDKAEDRERFDKAMKAIGLETPNSGIAHSLEEAYQVAIALDSLYYSPLIYYGWIWWGYRLQ